MLNDNTYTNIIAVVFLQFVMRRPATIICFLLLLNCVLS